MSKKNVTKAQLENLLSRLSSEINDDFYDGLCYTGQSLVDEMREMLGEPVHHNGVLHLDVVVGEGFYLPAKDDVCNNSSYKVEVRTTDGKLLNSYIDEVDYE